MAEPVRCLVLWFPDWPVTALRRERPGSAPGPVAFVHAGAVVACSSEAREAGVRRGQRRRDAQSRCPSLAVLPADQARDQRLFSPVVSLVEQHAPGVQIIRPGLCALRVRGPARYHGGELPAACFLLDLLAEQEELPGVRAGVADGVFTAQLAARATAAHDPVRVVPADESAPFLAPLPVTSLDEPALADLLARLGVHTLGAFAALDPQRVQDRLGTAGGRLQALAAGADSRPLLPRTPPPELTGQVSFEPALESAEQVAFGMRMTADAFVAQLGAHDLVCTELRVELTGERGERDERVWLHPGAFDAGAVVDRVRWQLAETNDRRPGQAPAGDGRAAPALRSGVTRVRIEPETVVPASAHRPALFGGGPTERVHHALSRVQAMLGHRGVLTPQLGGGRWLAERQTLVPWGDRIPQTRDRALPWPGSLPPPWPASVYPRPRIVEVLDGQGAAVEVDERGELSAAPARLVAAGTERAVVSWAGPWTVDERGWDAARARRAHRFQMVDAEQDAWLLIRERGRWAAEAKYD